MSDKDEAPDDGGAWAVIPYQPGEDETWDQLGEDWSAVRGMTPASVRLYARWGTGPLTGVCLVGEAVTASLVRSIPVGRLELLNRNESGFPIGLLKKELAPLQRERNTDPERFAEQVANYYTGFARWSSRPVKEMAEHSGVPVATMRSWIREARLRGKLPPGTRGKAG
ncbi:hypothetical protein [Actinomadura fibrosa]|uniref:Uncharacterized protein n=1 Tax=Actinomadura fibrosa TaxID=111802 RepID=A0ABW2XIR2_9ACTN|nr:hypothetical protein [Actinomadura fibrosa]